MFPQDTRHCIIRAIRTYHMHHTKTHGPIHAPLVLSHWCFDVSGAFEDKQTEDTATHGQELIDCLETSRKKLRGRVKHNCVAFCASKLPHHTDMAEDGGSLNLAKSNGNHYHGLCSHAAGDL